MRWGSILFFNLALVYVIQTYERFVVLKGLSVESRTRFKKKNKINKQTRKSQNCSINTNLVTFLIGLNIDLSKPSETSASPLLTQNSLELDCRPLLCHVGVESTPAFLVMQFSTSQTSCSTWLNLCVMCFMSNVKAPYCCSKNTVYSTLLIQKFKTTQVSFISGLW